MRKPVAKPSGRIYVNLTVSDMKSSIDFYTTVLGFFYDHGIRERAWLTQEGLLLTLSLGEVTHEAGFYFGWSLSSLDELTQKFAALAARHLPLSGPPDVASGRLYFFLYDPDSYPICFSFQPMDYE